MEIRSYLIGLAIRHQGDWHEIVEAIKNKEEIKEEELHVYLEYLHCKTLTILDPEYPEYLKQIMCPPIVLFYYGDISLISDYSKNVAIVGSRDASQEGLLNIYSIAENIGKRLNVVSGLARGIDAAAHQGIISGGGKTIGVLGCGIEMCYPSCNKKLYDEIKRNHLLISEYYGYISPEAKNFPQRNRLIVAFSKGTLIGESFERSGTSITANFALDMCRELMAVPSGNINNSLSNSLIKDGCYVVTSAEDIFTYLGV